jgi:putative endonuclease
MNREGARAEDLCAELLRAAGLKLVERNWRCRLGEIDLIAEEKGTLVFAEVRMRARGNFGGAAESVTAAKRSRLIAAARLYLMRRPEATCRFDVFLIDGPPRRVQWIRNAFGE